MIVITEAVFQRKRKKRGFSQSPKFNYN